jgi:hypothetical protein
MKKLFYCLAIASIVLSACKKEKENYTQLNDTQLTSVVSSSTVISGKLQSLMTTTLTDAALGGQSIESAPDVNAGAASAVVQMLKSNKMKSSGNWTGPDASGWFTYTFSYTSIYTYTQKIRYKDSTITCINSTEYNGADGSFSFVTTTELTHYTKNKIVLWKGYSDITYKTFGNSDISNIEWKFVFTDWNPNTGAGTYDWFWSANSLGGNPVPYHRYLNIIALDRGTTPSTLHVKITWYDDGGVQVGTWEYNTSWSWAPVDMSGIPQ